MGAVVEEVRFDEKRNFFIVNFNSSLNSSNDNFYRALTSYMSFLEGFPHFAYANYEGERDLARALEDKGRGIVQRIKPNLGNRIKNPEDLRTPRRTFPLDEADIFLSRGPKKALLREKSLIV